MPSDNFLFIQQKINDRVAFKAKYNDVEQRRLLPYVLGWNSNSEEVVLCYEFTNPSPEGWRCFKVAGLKDLQNSSAPLPDNLPDSASENQNCVSDIETKR